MNGKVPVSLMTPLKFSLEEYAGRIFVHGFCNRNARAPQREYHQRFPKRKIPAYKIFSSLFPCLSRTTGSFPSTSATAEQQD